MTLLHLEATGLTLSTLFLLSVMLSTNRNSLYMALLSAFTTSVLFAAITSWFCLFLPDVMPRLVVQYATTASWWILPFLAGVVVAQNYSSATDAEKKRMRFRLGAVLILGFLIVLGLFILAAIL